MNNKGFTLVELLVSFVLSMVLVIILFELIINLKEVYQTSGIKTELLNKQNLMVNKIYSDLTEKKVSTISYCGAGCVSFSFYDNTTKMLYIDTTNNILNYDNYIIKLDSNSSISTMLIENIEVISSKNDHVLVIDVPITHTLFKNENFGINIIYPYNSTEIISNL